MDRSEMTQMYGTQRAPRVGMFVLLAIALWSANARAEETVPVDIEAAIHLKVLSFDSNMVARPGDRLVIAVVHEPSDAESVKQSAAIRGAFSTLARKVSVQRKTVSVVGVPYSPLTLAADLAAQRADVIYVCAGIPRDAIGAITVAARPRNAPTLTNTRYGVQSGLAIGVVRVDDKPKIIVNLAAVKYLGMKLNPALLRLAEVLQ
jgi:hypothetical protein